MTDRIFEQFDSLFDYLAGVTYSPVIWNVFSPLCTLLYKRYMWFNIPEFERTPVVEDEIDLATNTAVLCFTGEFKSTFAAQYLKNLGYDVYLYYRYKPSKGRNSGSQYLAEKVAEKLQLPLYVDYTPVYWQLQTKFIEVFNGALMFALDNGLFPCRVAVGSYYNLSLVNNNFEKYGAGTKEFWDVCEHIWKAAYPKFTVYRPFINMEALWSTAVKYPSLLDIVPKNMYTYVLKTDFGLIDNPSKGIYFGDLGIIQQDYIRSTGDTVDTAEDLWKKCFFYNIAKSKYYEDLKTYRFKKKSKLSI